MKRYRLTIIVLLISLSQVLADYNNYSLKDFASIVASQNNINIVVDEQLDNQFDFIITKKIENYTNLDVFRELLNKRGFQLQNKGSYYLIIKKADRLVDKMYVYKTKNIDAKIAAEKIEPILSSFYKKEQQISNTKKNNIKNRISISEDTNTTKTTKKNFAIYSIDHKNLVLTYKDDKIKRYTAMLLANMDKIKQQITINCKVYEIKTSALTKEGIQMQILGQTLDKVANLKLNIAGSITPIISSNSDRLRVDTLISLLNDNTDSTLIGTPNLTLLEGSSATVKDGKTYPITTQQTTTTNASTSQTQQTTKYIDIGTSFSVKYDYEQNGYNYIKIALSKKDLLNYNPDDKTIITTNRDITTDIRIRDGETVIIAGVGSDIKEKNIIKVPYLSQIPILGELLKYKYDNKKKTTLVISINVVKADRDRTLVKDLIDAKFTADKKSIRIKKQ